VGRRAAARGAGEAWPEQSKPRFKTFLAGHAGLVEDIDGRRLVRSRLLGAREPTGMGRSWSLARECPLAVRPAATFGCGSGPLSRRAVSGAPARPRNCFPGGTLRAPRAARSPRRPMRRSHGTSRADRQRSSASVRRPGKARRLPYTVTISLASAAERPSRLPVGR
jgi:hypothetical protein